MRVLVTGGAGFIGSHLVDALLAGEHDVTALDNFDPYYSRDQKLANVRAATENRRYRLVEGDIRDVDVVQRVFEETKPGAVFHIAARAGVRPSLEHPHVYVDVNIHGTLNILDAARACGSPRLLVASTSSVYGSETEVPFREDAALLSIVSPYAASKLGMEAMCHTYASVYGLRILVFRLFTVYGPRQRPDMAIHRFTKRILAGEAIELYGARDTYRDYTYVSDIVAGFVAGLGVDDIDWGVFNLGGGRPTYLRDLVAEIEKATGKSAVVREAPQADGDVPRTLADISRARALLGYEPATTVQDGVPRFVEWYLRKDSGGR